MNEKDISIEEVHIIDNKNSTTYQEHNDKILAVLEELKTKLLEGKELSIYFSIVEDKTLTSGCVTNASLIHSIKCTIDLHELLLRVSKLQVEQMRKLKK